MADNLASATTQDASQAAPSGAAASPAAFPPGTTNANHGYTSAQYVSRHRPTSTQSSGAQGPYGSSMRSTSHQQSSSLQHQNQLGYAISPQQQSQTSSTTVGSQGYVIPPPARPPIISSPSQKGLPAPPTVYPQSVSLSQSDPYPPSIGTPRYSNVGLPRPATPALGGPVRPLGPTIRAPNVGGPTGSSGYYGTSPVRPMNSNTGQAYPSDYARGAVRHQPYSMRQDVTMGPGGAGNPGQGMGPGAPGPGMGPRPGRPSNSQQGSGYPIANRFSTQSLPGWDHDSQSYNGNGPVGHHSGTRLPPATWNDPVTQNGVGPGAVNHRRATSTQLQPTYYSQGEHHGLDRQASLASRYNGGPYPSNSGSYQPQPQYPTSPNRQLIRHQLADVPLSSVPRSHTGLSSHSEAYFHPNTSLRKLSISESLDGGRISLDSNASIESGYGNRQPSLYPVPNMYSREVDSNMDAFPPNRQRSASKSSTYSAHSVNSDYYADFDSIAVQRSTTPNGGTPQISIQSAQGYPTSRADPFSMRARTPSPGRTRQGSIPPLVNRGANPPVFLVTSLPQSESSRRSAEFVRMQPTQPKITRLQGERSQSFSSYSTPTFDPAARQAALPSSASSGALGPPAVRKPPIVYPALLSRVANAFVQRITTSSRIKDSIEYKDCFDGRDAVQSRLNLTPNGGLKRALSRSSSKEKKDQRLWITSVPKEVSDSVSADEKKRQEVIYELIYTEKDFVNDLKYLNDKWITPIRNLDLLPESRREAFIDRVFYNINDVYAVNSKLGDALLKRQQTYTVIPEIGDIFLEHVVNFSPFVLYGANQIEAKYEFEHEKNINSAFSKFVEETERRPESRKLELNGYLTKPTTRLGRYPLLLEAVLKYTPDDNPDKEAIPQAIAIIKDFLQKVNLESGKCENAFNLRQINKGLQWKGEPMELNLLAKDRQLIMKGPLKKKGTSSEQADLYVFVFDHVLLLTKEKKGKGGEGYKVHKRPIPLELLTLSTMEEPIMKNSRRSSSLIPHKATSASTVVSKITPASGPLSKITSDSKSGYPIVFTHIGRNGGSFTLYATTHAGRKNWMDKIQKQIQALKNKADSWRLLPVSERFFTAGNKVNCSATLENGRRLVIGTDSGVFVGRPKGQFIKIIARERVSQVDVLEEERILLVLAEKQLYAYGLEVLDSSNPNAQNKHKKLGTSVSFFKTGVCQNRTLVGIVKNSSNALNQGSTIKTLEPIEQAGSKKSKPRFKSMFIGGNTELFKLYKDFYIPRETNSLHFLRNTLCVGCSKGFELIDLSNLNTQDLLDFSDPTLDFVHKKDENLKPLAIYRIGTVDSFTFLLCYEEFSFYVDKTGRRARKGWIIHWEG
ncbi:RHO1 GDP-GTP exchange protein 2, partial [Entomortierella lignicola]